MWLSIMKHNYSVTHPLLRTQRVPLLIARRQKSLTDRSEVQVSRDTVQPQNGWEEGAWNTRVHIQCNKELRQITSRQVV